MATSSENLPRVAPEFRRALAAWFERARRKLPWRAERSLYRTVVSEFMLQQTQVTTVLPYFDRWMRALPDFAALAAVDEAVVLKLWEGLGYYRRARFLHALAREIVVRGKPPQTALGWTELPGVGPYTAAAIASLAFDDPAACVDGNVVRILARLTNETHAFPDSSSAVKHFTPLARALLDDRAPGRHNEALMELGATLCVRRNPRCDECPVADFCAARRIGNADSLPRIARPKAEQRSIDRVWCVRRGRLLLHRIPDHATRLRGLHELPTAEQAGVKVTALKPGHLLASHRRTITRFQITERIYRTEHARGTALVWVPIAKLDSVTLSGPHRRWLDELVGTARKVVRSNSRTRAYSRTPR